MADIVNCFALKSTRENSDINFLSKGVELGQLMDEYMGISFLRFFHQKMAN